jgi:hypothetical protein
MLGALFRIGKELGLERGVVVRRRPARPRAGNRPDVDNAGARLDQNFGARSGDCERAEVEKVQIRRRIDPPKGASKRCDRTT